MKNKYPLEKKAPIIAMSIAFFLAIIKFIVWIISWSVALLSSAMDSLLDTWVSIFNFFAIKIASEWPDKKHNYWHWKIEAIAASIEWTIITISWLYIIYESIKKIIYKEAISHISWTLIVMFISIIASWFLVYFLNYVYKKTQNLVIKWDALHYKTDLFTNLAVIVSLVIIFFFPSLYFIDWIIWFLIWIYIIHEAIELIKKWVDLLLDTRLEEHQKVEEILKSYIWKKINSFHCLKTRAGWSKEKFVEFHFVMNPETTILEAHNIWEEIEENIKNISPNSKWHIVWHVDPYDDSKTNWCN